MIELLSIVFANSTRCCLSQFGRYMLRWNVCGLAKPNQHLNNVRGHPISHFHCSRFHPTPKLELRSTPISKLRSALKSELYSTFTSGVTVDVK